MLFVAIGEAVNNDKKLITMVLNGTTCEIAHRYRERKNRRFYVMVYETSFGSGGIMGIKR